MRVLDLFIVSLDNHAILHTGANLPFPSIIIYRKEMNFDTGTRYQKALQNGKRGQSIIENSGQPSKFVKKAVSCDARPPHRSDLAQSAFAGLDARRACLEGFVEFSLQASWLARLFFSLETPQAKQKAVPYIQRRTSLCRFQKRIRPNIHPSRTRIRPYIWADCQPSASISYQRSGFRRRT
jgi:hypothetical protein